MGLKMRTLRNFVIAKVLGIRFSFWPPFLWRHHPIIQTIPLSKRNRLFSARKHQRNLLTSIMWASPSHQSIHSTGRYRFMFKYPMARVPPSGLGRRFTTSKNSNAHIESGYPLLLSNTTTQTYTSFTSFKSWKAPEIQSIRVIPRGLALPDPNQSHSPNQV